MVLISTDTSELGFTFVAIRKNASSSIASAIYSLKNSIAYDHPEFPKNINSSNIFMYNSEEKEENINSLFTFTCIRDPFERLVSGFTHKVIKHPHEEIKQYDEAVPNHRNLINNTPAYFDNFLTFLEGYDFSKIDPHFALQYDCARFDRINYDLVINQSDIYNGWTEVQKVILNMPDLPKNIIHKSGSERLLDVLRPFESRVKTLYAKDYGVLGGRISERS